LPICIFSPYDAKENCEIGCGRTEGLGSDLKGSTLEPGRSIWSMACFMINVISSGGRLPLHVRGGGLEAREK